MKSPPKSAPPEFVLATYSCPTRPSSPLPVRREPKFISPSYLCPTRRCAGDFLDGVCAVVEILGSPANRPADSSAEWIILKTRGHYATDGHQLIPRVPGVGIDAVP